jgi:hypothetical protein
MGGTASTCMMMNNECLQKKMMNNEAMMKRSIILTSLYNDTYDSGLFPILFNFARI